MESLGGHIQLILGPMFSGKSSELLRRVRRFTVAGKKCIVIKHTKDVRYSKEDMATHDKILHSALPLSSLGGLMEKVAAYDVFAIDEGQFFPDIVEFSDTVASKYGKIVIISALDGTFERKPFDNGILDLVCKSEDVVKLRAICMICKQKEAAFSKRIGNETQVELIGGADKYASACRDCHNK